jgi:uncharacterized membrane protein
MLILGALVFSIMILMRYYFVTKHECYISKVNYHIEVGNHVELMKKLQSLSPTQLEDVIEKCEIHFKLKEEKY